MLLVVANYKEELPPEILTTQDENLKVEILNENKWWNFAFKLQKLIIKYKPSKVLHIGIAWWKDESLIGKVFHIQRSFLRWTNTIFDSQKHRFSDNINIDLPKSWIVTKLNKKSHTSKLYDFAPIFDLETFRVGQLTNFFSIPIISIKWVTDTLIDLESFEQQDEIGFLLDPQQKRGKRQKILKELKKWLQNLYPQMTQLVKTLSSQPL